MCVKNDRSDIVKIGVFRALQLGDILCAIPAIRTLKRYYPDAELTYIGLPSMRTLLERFEFVDAYMDFPGHVGLPEQSYDPDRTLEFIGKMWKQNFDLLIQMHGDGTIVNQLLHDCRPKQLVGFCPEPEMEDANWKRYPDHIHEVERHLALLAHLGLPVSASDRTLTFPLSADDWDRFALLRSRYGLQRYAIVHVGSRCIFRQWPLVNFVVLARHLQNQGLQIVLTGTSEEEPLVTSMENLLGNPAQTINLAGRTDLGQVGCLVKEATVMISNCTGISHIAAALQTQSLVLNMDGEPERWGPLNQQLHYTYDAREALSLEKLCKDLDELLELSC